MKDGSVRILPDSAVITDDYLIKNIDSAWETWMSSAWRKDVDFDTFCRYVLPYRVDDEHIGEEWRAILKKKYLGLINGEENIKRAFAVVCDTVFKEVLLSNAYCEYNLDPISCALAGRAECSQRCMYLVAVLRALGIPAVIDGTPMWADYSNKGHAWVAMVLGDGKTYTVYEKDSIARSLNPIDASEFLPRYKVMKDDHCPYEIKYAKTPVKIYRLCYECVNEVKNDVPKILANPFIMDVSASYGLKAAVRVNTEECGLLYLCAYMSGADWAPVAVSAPSNGKVEFINVGKNTVCIVAALKNGFCTYVTKPFYVGEKGVERYFTPIPNVRQEMCLKRKYPLCAYTVDTWGYMKGGVFEGAETEDFSKPDTLAMITTMPFGMTSLKVESVRKYRYLRYKAPNDNRSSLAELQFYKKGPGNVYQLLTGNYISQGADAKNLEKVFDGNLSTVCRGQVLGYSVGLDLGEGNESSVDKIMFCPSTDLNFVEPKHLYELYYFTDRWNLAKRIYSDKDELRIGNMPQGVLFLLKDKSGGVEERIFEYVADKQIWH